MTDPRIEAAITEMKRLFGAGECVDRAEWSACAECILAAADAAAWNTDIKKAPGFRQTIIVHLKNGDTTLANNEFPQGEDGWVDMMGDNITEDDIEAWMLIPRFTTTTKEATP